jgi:phospholipase C
VAGDLTSAFNFATPNAAIVTLPSTTAFLPPDLDRHPDYEVVAPVDPKLPRQEPGVRHARALPYALHADGHVVGHDGSFQIEFANVGRAAAVFHVRSGRGSVQPRSYTVEANKRLRGSWPVLADIQTVYDLSVYAPNGFFRSFKGRVGAARKAWFDVQARYEAEAIELTFANRGASRFIVRVADQYSGRTTAVSVDPRQSEAKTWSLQRSFNWYDLIVTVDGEAGYEMRLAGHVENGKPSVTDPAMGGLRLKD